MGALEVHIATIGGVFARRHSTTSVESLPVDDAGEVLPGSRWDSCRATPGIRRLGYESGYESLLSAKQALEGSTAVHVLAGRCRETSAQGLLKSSQNLSSMATNFQLRGLNAPCQ